MRGANLALRLLVELAAVAALALAGRPLWAAAFAVVAVVNGTILRRSEPPPDQPAPSGR